MKPLRLVVPPFVVEVDGTPFEILEVIQHAIGGYSVAVRMTYKGIRSRILDMSARDEQDLIRKLKAELAKIKWFEFLYGLEEVRRIIT